MACRCRRLQASPASQNHNQRSAAALVVCLNIPVRGTTRIADCSRDGLRHATPRLRIKQALTLVFWHDLPTA